MPSCFFVGMGACSKYVNVRNDLVTQREAVNAAWSTVDVALQRRADLIPNLVSTVKGFASHETEVFKNIADARAALIGARTPRIRSPPTINSRARFPDCW